jgi:uroporphyrinogen decarboxylase
MVFDSWGGALTKPAYMEYSLGYMQRIVDQLQREKDGRRIPVTLFTKGGGLWLNELADSGCDALGLDWVTDIGDARRQVGERVALQGNMDPAIMAAGIDTVRREAKRILESFGHGSGHVFNLGHGITPRIEPGHVAALVDTVHEASVQYHV